MAENTSISKKKQNKDYSLTHIRRKRAPPKFSQEKNVIYLNSKSVKSTLLKCEKLIKDNKEEIIIYCLGEAVSKGVLLALQICDKYPKYKSHVATFTTTLIDDLEPTVDDEDYKYITRNKSGLQIKLIRDI